MHTTSYWFTIPRDLLYQLNYPQAEIIDGFSGLAYCLHHLSSMLLMADLRDIDRCIGDKSGEWYVRYHQGSRSITPFSPVDKGGASVGTDAFDPTLFIFDAYPGGIGFSDLLYEKHNDLLNATRRLILICPCGSGCPSCVGPTLEVGPSAKNVALAILDLIIEGK